MCCKKQHNPEDLQRLHALRLIDDDFMTICFDGYIEGVELLLKVILDRDDLKVSEVKAQKVIMNLHGRDLRLDIYATGKDGKKYNIEIQRADKGAHEKRAGINLIHHTTRKPCISQGSLVIGMSRLSVRLTYCPQAP